MSGVNNVAFKAIAAVDGDSDIKYRTITVDATKPVIYSMLPKNNVWVTKGDFNVTYTEKNLKNVTLAYGIFGDMRSNPSLTCPSGENKVCNFSGIDLTAFDGKQINFTFTIFDIAGNSAVSKTHRVFVDLTKPNITLFDRTNVGKKVTFIIEVDEDNFDKIIFRDLTDIKPVWKTLCANLIVGRCIAVRNFAYRQHNLEIKVLDDAGNVLDVTDSKRIFTII
jgi:hypothetical protein